MKLRSARRHIEEGTKNLFRNRLMSLAAILTVSACTFIFILSLCLLINLNYVLAQLETSIGISVFVMDSLKSSEVKSLMEEIETIPHVTDVRYISPDEALLTLKDQWDDSAILTDLDEDNPLPRSFEISLDNAKFQGDVLDALNGLEQKGIEHIRHAKDEADMLIAVNTGLRIAGIVILFVLSAISITIIMNTIRITVYTRRNEINIMKYVGATDWFIRWPFLVEGILIGVIGSIIPGVLCFMSYDKTVSLFYEELLFIQNLVRFKTGTEVFAIIMPVILCIGVLLGMIGSVSSIRRHLKV